MRTDVIRNKITEIQESLELIRDNLQINIPERKPLSLRCE